MIKEGLIHQAMGVQLPIDATEWTPAQELPGLMQCLWREFGPVGMSPQAAAPSMSMPSSATTTTMPSTATAPAASTSAAKIKAEHRDPFQVQPISQRIVQGDVVSYVYKCLLCEDPPTATNACRACTNRHLGRVLLCMVCTWSSYNPDILKYHMRNKHSWVEVGQ